MSLLLTVSCLAPISAIAAEITYTVTFLDENGGILGSELTVARGQTVDPDDIPALPKSTVEGHEDYIKDNEKEHSTYSWDSDPAATVIESNTIFTRIRTTEKHGYDFGKPQFKFQNNNKSGLMAFYECPQCGSVGEVGVEILGATGQGLKIRIDGTAIGGDGIAYEGVLNVGTIKTIVELMQKVGVPIPGWVNTVLTVLDYADDVVDKIVEQTTECAKTGHLYGAPTYSWNDSHTECTATFTCTRSECHDNYENHAVSKKMNVTGPFYTYGSCTEDGIETYNATCKFTDTDKGTVDGFDIAHDFETKYEKVWQPKTGHKWNIRVSNNDATCTEDGTYNRVCANCGLTETKPDTGSAKGHTAGALRRENEIPATCTEGGSYDEVRRCVRCNMIMESNHITTEPEGHTPAPAVKDKDSEVPADCEHGGHYYNVTYCSVCGNELWRDKVETEAKGHKPVVVNENLSSSSCTVNGTYERVTKCSVCGKELSERETITLDTADHDWELVQTLAPTCEADGKQEYICKVCHTHRADYEFIPQLEHKYIETEISPDCTNAGYTLFTCKYCGDSYTEEGEAAKGHIWDEGTVTKEPTCEETGTKTYKCTVCGATNTSDIEKKNHSWSAEPVAPTCSTFGYTKYTCSNCGDERIEKGADATGHKAATRDVIIREASCTQEGAYDKVYYCEICNEELSREHYTIAKKPHNPNKSTTNATCTEQGYTMYKCKDCGYEYKASFIACKGHKHVAIPAVPATCIKTGKTEGEKCSVCGEIFVKPADTPTVDHKWNGGVITTQPTVEETGIKTYTCTVCGEKKTEVVPKLTVEEATPTNTEADKAPVNKVIKKPAGITTVSHLKRKELEISFNKVKGAQNYRVMYRKQGAKKWNYAWTDGKTQYTLKNLKAGGLYEFMFAAYKKNARGEWERGNYSVTSYRYYYKATVKKVKPAKKSATVKWKKDKAGNGYELFYSTDKDMKKRKKITIKNKNTTSYTIKGLKKGKKYYIRVRSIKKKAGKSYTGEFSSQKTVKVK